MGKYFAVGDCRSAWTLALVPGAALADAGVTRSAQGEPLSAWIAIACVVVLALAVAGLFLSIWHHRRAAAPNAKHFHRSLAVELAWTAVPVLILVLAAYPATHSTLTNGLLAAKTPAPPAAPQLAATDRTGELGGPDALAARMQ